MLNWLRSCCCCTARRSKRAATPPPASVPAEEQLDRDYEGILRGVEARVAAGGAAERERIKAMLANPYDDAARIQFPDMQVATPVRLYAARPPQITEIRGPASASASSPAAVQTLQPVLRDLPDPRVLDKGGPAVAAGSGDANPGFVVIDVSGSEDHVGDPPAASTTTAARGAPAEKGGPRCLTAPSSDGSSHPWYTGY